MKKTFFAALAFALSAQPAIAHNFFAVKASPALAGVEFMIELSSERDSCPSSYQFGRINLFKSGVDGTVPHSVGCWILMPGGNVVAKWIGLATGEESTGHYKTTDFFTTQQADYWWQFTPGFDEEPSHEPQPIKSDKPPLPQGGPVGQIAVPFNGGEFYLIYQLSRKQAAVNSCHEGAKAVLISATNNTMYPRTVSYADGCWYKNTAHEIIIKATAFDGSGEFVHSYTANEFNQAEDFWQVVTGEK